MQTDGSYTYAYNAESEIKSAAGVNYTYDGDGNRVEKSNGKLYWYGAGTEIIDESDLSGNFTNEYVFFAGKRIAMRNVSTGVIYYYEEDMLGSSRTIVQAGQTSVCYDADFLPFGYEKQVTNTCSQNYKFEGKERDTETSNDDFGARYYSNRFGRWLSADWSSVPAPVPYANLTNPQTLNLYGMVSDNPESFADLDGHCPVNQVMGPMGSGCQKAPTNGEHDPKEDACAKGGTGSPCPNNTNAGATVPTDQSKANQQAQQQNASNATMQRTGGNRTPSSGDPNTTERLPGASPGNYTERTYGPNGRAAKDIDHGHDHGAGDPHAHDWDWSKNPARQPGRALTPEEAAGADTHRFSWVSDHKGAIIAGAVITVAAVAIVASGGTLTPLAAAAAF